MRVFLFFINLAACDETDGNVRALKSAVRHTGAGALFFFIAEMCLPIADWENPIRTLAYSKRRIGFLQTSNIVIMNYRFVAGKHVITLSFGKVSSALHPVPPRASHITTCLHGRASTPPEQRTSRSPFFLDRGLGSPSETPAPAAP